MNVDGFIERLEGMKMAIEHIKNALMTSGIKDYHVEMNDIGEITISFDYEDVLAEVTADKPRHQAFYKTGEGETVVLQAKEKESLVRMKQKMVKKKGEADDVEFEVEP